MKLNSQGLRDRAAWEEAGYRLPDFDHEKVTEETREHPLWVHFGAGNIFRAFGANVVQRLLDAGVLKSGLIVAEGFDYEIIEKMNRTHDDYSILVTLKADGNVEKTVVGSVMESHTLDAENDMEFARMKEIFTKDSLQIASFTITEKGYCLRDGAGKPFWDVAADFKFGPKVPKSYIGKVAALLYARFESGEKPIAMVSMDNCSHNGDKLYAAVVEFAENWSENGLVAAGFLEYVKNPKKVSFPWSMIDKITPRPDEAIAAMIRDDGVENPEAVVTAKHTYVAPFVNAEECEYLVIEDAFANGRPALEEGGVIFTSRETVEKAEKMKVCTCLNPLHTALAVFGCLLGYEKISEEMRDRELKKLAEEIGYTEGLPVVNDPKILDPKEFIDTVLNVRLPNSFMPDTPQRIATDTSQKLAVRFGETIKAYAASPDLEVKNLKFIPFVIAGWLRYLMGVNDAGEAFTVSPDPLFDTLRRHIGGLRLGKGVSSEELRPILENKNIFGVNLCEIGMADIVLTYLNEMTAGTGAVREALKKVLQTETGCEVLEKIEKMKVVPVIVMKDAKNAASLAQALCEGGLPCGEVTFRTDAAEEAIRIMTEKFPQMLVGAGTVLTCRQVDRAVAAGAKFIVSPGFDPEIVDYCIEKKIPIIPGCITPSEVAQALKRGLRVVKFFPAEQFGGIDTIRAMAAPYAGVKFMPTGGVNKENLKTYLSCDSVIACGGSWMVKDRLIENGMFDEIKALANEAVRMTI